MKKNLNSIFFELLKRGLWGSRFVNLPNYLSESEWEIIYTHAVKQTVEGILFESFSLLTDQQLPPKNILIKWAVRIDQLERSNKKMNSVISEQWDYFTQVGVKATLLKGQGVASCYNNSLRRVCGDIDWFFEGEGYKVVLNDLRKKRSIKFPLNSFGCDWNGIQADFHKRLFDIFSPFKTRYLNTLIEEHWKFPHSLKVDERNVTILSPELQLLQVNMHILKHMLFLGIGLRQLCDSARLYYEYRNAINPEVLRKMYIKAGALKWMNLLHRILVEFIGLPQQHLPFPYCSRSTREADKVLGEIWQSGNFGFHDMRYGEERGGTLRSPNRLDRFRKSCRGFKLYYKYAPEEVVFFSAHRVRAGLSSMITPTLRRIF